MNYVAWRERIYQYTQEGVGKLASWFVFMALALLCWFLARLVWLVLTPPVSPSSPILDYTPLVVQNSDNTLFHVFAEPPAKENTATLTGVELKGVLMASPANLSSAILSVSGKVMSYKIGERVADSDYMLDLVDADMVVLSNGRGSQITLNLTKPPLNNIDNIAPNATGQITNDTVSRFVSNTPASAKLPTEATSSATAESTNQKTARPDEAAAPTADPSEYLGRLGMMATGSSYRIADNAPQQLREQFGMMVGDEIIEIGGKSIGGNPAEDVKLLESLRQRGGVEVRIRRGNQVITLSGK